MPTVDKLILLLHSLLSAVTKTVPQYMPTIDTFRHFADIYHPCFGGRSSVRFDSQSSPAPVMAVGLQLGAWEATASPPLNLTTSEPHRLYT